MPNTPVQAAAEGLPSIHRRRLLIGLAAASATTASLAVPDVAEPATIEDPAERAKHVAKQLAQAMKELNPDRDYEVRFTEDNSFVYILPSRKPQLPVYDGPNFYEVELPNGKRPILWLERHGYKTAPGHYYTGAHRWGNRFETSPRRFSEKQLRFIRKVENFGRA
ncbi:hypothetical protein [Neorhizobium sp. DT-125]|uniref:hypothetical protein n=1 Tax=Neorhizobium sp. DT-125 TaxID=3396163 RepID=UPI003F1DA442